MGPARAAGVVLSLATLAAGCAGEADADADAVVQVDDVLSCLADVVPGVFVSTHDDDLDDAARSAGQGGARLEWDAGGEASVVVESTVEAARATLDRYTATITGTSFGGWFRRYGNVVVHYRADPGAHEAGIVRCATRGR